MGEQQDLLRILPAIDRILREEPLQNLSRQLPQEILSSAVQELIGNLRQEILKTGKIVPSDRLLPENIAATAAQNCRKFFQPSLRKVINATGTLLHTNLGRAPLSAQSLHAINTVAAGYSNLEFELDSGCRGERFSHVEKLLTQLTGAEAALVVNNNSGAVLLALTALAKGREAIVSRGELVEIGGAFRIPEVMEAGGVMLREVGSSNRTHLHDYQQAINADTAILLKVHTSNYRVSGFTSAVDSVELVKLAEQFSLPVIEDLGSGCMMDLSAYGVGGEPTVRQVVKTGVGVVTFSGDKLVGGPQAGIVVGRRDLIEQVKRHPLNRALRIDKLTLAFLEEVLKCYLDEEKAVSSLPTLAMLTMSPAELRRRANRLKGQIRRQLGNIPGFSLTVKEGISRAGGGALPMVEIPTWLVALQVDNHSASALERFFRSRSIPIITRILDDQLIFDPRTLFVDDGLEIARACGELLKEL